MNIAQSGGPVIGLRYTGSDEDEIRRLKATDGVRYFQPVDAREVLATPGSEYEPDDASRKMLGKAYEPREQGLSVPQLLGADAELSTGLSHEKYGRSQVVKAIPEAMVPTVGGPQSTVGRPLDLSQVGEGGGAQAARVVSSDEGNDGARLSEGMTRDEIIAELDKRGVEFNRQARKDELAETLDRQSR